MIASETVAGEQLAGLFREAGSAHHRAFVSSDGEDSEWPMWYAEFLQPRLNLLLSIRRTKSEIVYLLVKAERERSALVSNPSWPEFYAAMFIKEDQFTR